MQRWRLCGALGHIPTSRRKARQQRRRSREDESGSIAVRVSYVTAVRGFTRVLAENHDGANLLRVNIHRAAAGRTTLPDSFLPQSYFKREIHVRLRVFIAKRNARGRFEVSED